MGLVSPFLNQQVLVLNRLWQAVNVCTARRAISLLFEGRAQAVSIHDNGAFQTYNFHEWKDFSQQAPHADSVRSVAFRIRIPRVILLAFFDRLPRHEIRFTRHNIFERDKNTCQYCGKRFERRDLNLDHVVPRDQGGPTNWENIVCSCIPCNTRKANRTPSQAGMGLIRRPRRPRWRPFLQVSVTSNCDASWRHFIDMAYWNVELGEEIQ